MNHTPKKHHTTAAQCKTPPKDDLNEKRKRKLSSKALENLAHITDNSDTDESVLVTNVESEPKDQPLRKSVRKKSPTKKYLNDFINSSGGSSARKGRSKKKTDISDDDGAELVTSLGLNSKLSITHRNENEQELLLLEENYEATGRSMFGFNTPKKRDGMAIAALNTPKTPKTQKNAKTASKTPKSSTTPKAHPQTKTPDMKRRKDAVEPKTPSHIRRRVKNQIAKLIEANSDTDFSADGSDYEPSESDSSSSSEDLDADEAADDEPKTPHKGRRPIVVPVLPKTPSAARLRQSSRVKKSAEYVPESDCYFQSHSSSKILTSDHTLDRLKNPRLPADRIFSLLAEMKISGEHESSINAILEEYRSYFPKWMYILNEGFNLLLYGLGSKRQLLQSFHRELLAHQTVLVVNGFFPSLTLKDILDSITGEILDAGVSPASPHEAADMIEEEFALIPETHLYLIVHNLDGTMLRNARVQSTLARLSKVPNIHLLASIDHINTPLLWDHTKLSNFNFSWWDCTTMIPYSDEIAFENSLLVQNSGHLALSSMRSVFSSLTVNSRGIYMIIVKYQLKNKANPNYQGMPFKDLYWGCREAFLVSSDLALRAQLTEYLDHKLVKSKRSVDGSEQLTIPIESPLLQQFLEEQEKK